MFVQQLASLSPLTAHNLQDAGHPSFLQPDPQAVPARRSPRRRYLVDLRKASSYCADALNIFLTYSDLQRCYSTAGERVAKYEGTKDSKVGDQYARLCLCNWPRMLPPVRWDRLPVAKITQAGCSASHLKWLLIIFAGQLPRQLDRG